MNAKIALCAVLLQLNVCYRSELMIYIHLFSPPTFPYCTRSIVVGACLRQHLAHLLMVGTPAEIHKAHNGIPIKQVNSETLGSLPHHSPPNGKG